MNDTSGRPGGVPVGALAASALLDVLALLAENSVQAQIYQRRALDALRLAAGSAFAALGTSLVEPPAGSSRSRDERSANRALALDGAVVAVALLDLAARQGAVGDSDRRIDSRALALSLAGLILMAAAGKLKWPAFRSQPRLS